VIKGKNFLHSEYYQSSGMLIHPQNLYVPHSKPCTSHCEAQSSEISQQSKNPPCI
jgi:hypothetical protein